jgi:hypothetical protein
MVHRFLVLMLASTVLLVIVLNRQPSPAALHAAANLSASVSAPDPSFRSTTEGELRFADR